MKGTGRDLPFAGLLSDCPQQPWLGKAKSRSPELSLGLPHGRQEPNNSTPLPAASQAVHEKEAGIQSGTRTVPQELRGMWHLDCCTRCPPCLELLDGESCFRIGVKLPLSHSDLTYICGYNVLVLHALKRLLDVKLNFIAAPRLVQLSADAARKQQ